MARIEKSLAELRNTFNDSDRLWISRWSQGTDALRYPDKGPNSSGK